jgi:hypothetical protein
MATYCIWIAVPTYGSRDEHTGSRAYKQECFKQLRTAKKRIRALNKEIGHAGEVSVALCRGTQPCILGARHDKEVSTRRHQGAKKSAKQLRKLKRAAQAERRDPNYIPF